MVQRILRPMEYGDLLDETFDLYKKNFLLFAGIAAVLHLPMSMILYTAGYDTQRFGSILTNLIDFVVMGAASWAVAKIYLGGTTTIMGAYKAVLPRALPLIVTMVLGYIAFGVGILLLVIPGILVLTALMLLPPVVVLEEQGGFAALNRCWQLSKGHRLRIFVIGIITLIIISIISSVLLAPIILVSGIGFGGSPAGGIIGALFGLCAGLAQALATPIQAIVFILVYYDIRVRKEAFDLELLAQSIGEAAPGTPSAPEVKQF